ncbi:hypothetical protein [Thermomicrobium sp.]
MTEYQDLLVESTLRRMPRRERERVIDEVLRLVDLEETAERPVRTYLEEMVRRREVA